MRKQWEAPKRVWRRPTPERCKNCKRGVTTSILLVGVCWICRADPRWMERMGLR